MLFCRILEGGWCATPTFPFSLLFLLPFFIPFFLPFFLSSEAVLLQPIVLLALTILLSQPSECWDDSHLPMVDN